MSRNTNNRNSSQYLNTAEFFSDGPQLPKCLQFDISLESYNINASATDESAMEHVPAIKVFRSPDEAQVASIPLVHVSFHPSCLDSTHVALISKAHFSFQTS